MIILGEKVRDITVGFHKTVFTIPKCPDCARGGLLGQLGAGGLAQVSVQLRAGGRQVWGSPGPAQTLWSDGGLCGQRTAERF